MDWDISQFLFSQESLFNQKSDNSLKSSWKCQQCQKCFQSDSSLLRHERKENHKNTERERRKILRAMNRKGKGLETKENGTIQCRFCHMIFKSRKQRCKHYRKCEKDPKNIKYTQRKAESSQDNFFEKIAKIAFKSANHNITRAGIIKNYYKKAFNQILGSQMKKYNFIYSFQKYYKKQLKKYIRQM